MEVLVIVLYTVVVIVALLLIGLVLIQQSKGGGFGGTFGGVGESVFGAHASNHLTKLTVILVSVFFILTLLLAAITGRIKKDESGVIVKTVDKDLKTIVVDEEKEKSAVQDQKQEKSDSVTVEKDAGKVQDKSVAK